MSYLQCLFYFYIVLLALQPFSFFGLFWFNTNELNCMCVLNCFHHIFACIIPSVILIQSPNSHRLMLFVCSLCDSKQILSYLKSISYFRVNHPKNLIVCHNNVNSIRNKFYELSSLYWPIKVLMSWQLAKQNLMTPFLVRSSNYRLHRKDRNECGCGIMIYVKDSIPHRIVKEHTGVVQGIEYMSIELSMKSRKWNVLYIYKHQKISTKPFCEFMLDLCENFVSDDKLCVVMGDMNCNMLVKNELTEVCDIYGLTNLIKGPTCFKACNAIALDVLLTKSHAVFLTPSI